MIKSQRGNREIAFPSGPDAGDPADAVTDVLQTQHDPFQRPADGAGQGPDDVLRKYGDRQETEHRPCRKADQQACASPRPVTAWMTAPLRQTPSTMAPSPISTITAAIGVA